MTRPSPRRCFFRIIRTRVYKVRPARVVAKGYFLGLGWTHVIRHVLVVEPHRIKQPWYCYCAHVCLHYNVYVRVHDTVLRVVPVCMYIYIKKKHILPIIRLKKKKRRNFLPIAQMRIPYLIYVVQTAR